MQFEKCFPTDWHSTMMKGHAVSVDGLREVVLELSALGRKAEIWPRMTRSNSFQLSSAHCILEVSYSSLEKDV